MKSKSRKVELNSALVFMWKIGKCDLNTLSQFSILLHLRLPLNNVPHMAEKLPRAWNLPLTLGGRQTRPPLCGWLYEHEDARGSLEETHVCAKYCVHMLEQAVRARRYANVMQIGCYCYDKRVVDAATMLPFAYRVPLTFGNQVYIQY